MATWTVPATVLAIGGSGGVLRLRVELAGDVHYDTEVRLALPGSPARPLQAHASARLWLQLRVPPGTRVWFVSERRDDARRPMGRLVHRGKDLASGLLRDGHAVSPRWRS